MPGARDLAKPAPPKPPKVFKRQGAISPAEKAMVTAFVKDSPAEIRPSQVTALSKVMRRTPEKIRELIAEAREEFAAAAVDYVQIHKDATKGALADGDYEAAAKAAQWAMTNIASEGVRVIDKVAADGGGGTKIMIGVQMGGITPPNVKISPVD